MGLITFFHVPNICHLVPSCSSQHGSRTSAGEMKGSTLLTCCFYVALLCWGCGWDSTPFRFTLERAKFGFVRACKAEIETSASCLCWPPCASPGSPCVAACLCTQGAAFSQSCREWNQWSSHLALGLACPNKGQGHLDNFS